MSIREIHVQVESGQDNFETSGIRTTQSKNQREFSSIPRWDTSLSSETRRPLVSCGNERQRQARPRARSSKGREAGSEKPEIEEGEIGEKGRNRTVKREGKHERILRETKRNVKIQRMRGKTKWERRRLQEKERKG